MSDIICIFCILAVLVSNAAAAKIQVIDDYEGEIAFDVPLELTGGNGEVEGQVFWEKIKYKLETHSDPRKRGIAHHLKAIYTVDTKSKKKEIENTNERYKIPSQVHLTATFPLLKLELRDCATKKKIELPLELPSNIDSMSGEDLFNRVSEVYQKDKSEDVRKRGKLIVEIEIIYFDPSKHLRQRQKWYLIMYTSEVYNDLEIKHISYIDVCTEEKPGTGKDDEKSKYTDLMQHKNYTELHVALKLKRFFIAHQLIKDGADVNAKTTDDKAYTPLYLALEAKSEIPLVRAMLEKGADPNDRVGDGDFPLRFAVMSNRYEIAKLLLENENSAVKKLDANEKIKTSDATECNLLYLVVSETGILTSMGKLLIDEGAKVDEKVNYSAGKGWDTLLHVAVKNGKKDITKLLVDYGADVNAKNSAEKTSIELALNPGLGEVARVLLQSKTVDLKASVKDKTEKETTLLHLAVESGDLKTVQLMIHLGADPKKGTKDNKKETPIILAQTKARPDIEAALKQQKVTDKVKNAFNRL